VNARPIDVRFVAATHRDLRAQITRGQFREDLFFRLNGIAIEIPPLRDRPSEIEPLAELFITRACAQPKPRPAPPISPEARAVLRHYAWPGNVRELRNAMERAVVLAGTDPIVPAHLPTEIANAGVSAQRGVPRVISSSARGATAGSALRSDLEALERERILTALEQCGGNQSRAARMLGMRRATLIARLDAWGIPRPRKGAGDEE
jgi:DNA-binding NtrC family response regulator